MKTKTAIIGGGASGTMAAISAARSENIVTIFEKNEKLGKKILITGNGRCNITNRTVSHQNYHGTHPKFASSVLAQFSNTDTIKFFEDLGLILKEEDEGRLFPRSNQAQSVVDVLTEELERLGVEVKLNQKIKKVIKQKNKFHITSYQNKKYIFDKLIIATGGKSYPKTGSTGDGFRFAESLGHRIIKPFPASTPLRIKSIVCNKLQGIKIDATLKIFHNDKQISEKTGELLFTHLGLSAPVVLESSREVSRILTSNPKAKLECSINLLPEYSFSEIRNILLKRINDHPERNIGNQFIGILPKKVTPTILKHYDIDPLTQSMNISKKTLHRIIEILTDHREKIIGVLGWDSAQFTAGGVDISEIDSKNMQSQLVKGLHFCGEVVDIDGDSGGYNLQWAWSSGFVAGVS